MFFKALQGVKDRWARNKCGRSFHSLTPSLAETLAKCLNSPELRFPHPYSKNNQPCPTDLTRLGQESEGHERALATIKCSQNSHQHRDEKKMWLILLYFPRKSAWSSDRSTNYLPLLCLIVLHFFMKYETYDSFPYTH